MNAVKHTLDKMEWSGWLVIERSRNKDEVRNVKKNFGTNVAYLKQIFQQENKIIFNFKKILWRMKMHFFRSWTRLAT